MPGRCSTGRWVRVLCTACDGLMAGCGMRVLAERDASLVQHWPLGERAVCAAGYLGCCTV
jgi:hypothetical protein